MEDFNVYEDPRVRQLYEAIFRVLERENVEISVSVLINLFQTALLTYALTEKMDREEFILYVNSITNVIKKALFRPDRLERLDNFREGNNGIF